MSKKQVIGLVILLALIFLIVVMMRACRTDYDDPTPEGPPSGEVSYAAVQMKSVALAGPIA